MFRGLMTHRMFFLPNDYLTIIIISHLWHIHFCPWLCWKSCKSSPVNSLLHRTSGWVFAVNVPVRPAYKSGNETNQSRTWFLFPYSYLLCVWYGVYASVTREFMFPGSILFAPRWLVLVKIVWLFGLVRGCWIQGFVL